MRRAILILICILLFILDNSLVSFLSINNYYGSLLLVFVISYSINTDKIEALWIGVFSGFLQDIYFFHGTGINALLNMAICLLASYIGESLFTEKSFIPIIGSFFLSLLKGIMIYILLFVLGKGISLYSILFNSLYNLFLAILLYKRVYRLSEKPIMKKEWKF